MLKVKSVVRTKKSISSSQMWRTVSLAVFTFWLLCGDLTSQIAFASTRAYNPYNVAPPSVEPLPQADLSLTSGDIILPSTLKHTPGKTEVLPLIVNIKNIGRLASSEASLLITDTVINSADQQSNASATTFRTFSRIFTTLSPQGKHTFNVDWDFNLSLVEYRVLCVEILANDTYQGNNTACRIYNLVQPISSPTLPVSNVSDLAKAVTQPPAPNQLIDKFGALAVRFEANEGQFDNRIKYLARGLNYQLFLENQKAVIYAVPPPTETICSETGRSICLNENQYRSQESPLHLQITLPGSNPQPEIAPETSLDETFNYFLGENPANWRTNVKAYSRVVYKEVYPNIDLAYYGNGRELEYDFIVKPGADPEKITLNFEGASRIEKTPEGDLRIYSGLNFIRQLAPTIYQLDETGNRRIIRGGYVLRSENEISFQLWETYDPAKNLIIDPIVSFVTWFGESTNTEIHDVELDNQGYIYLVGRGRIPIVGTPYMGTPQGINDAFVAKMNPAGTALSYTTYIGGANNDGGYGLALDNTGNAYLTGEAGAGFPISPTVGAYQGTNRGLQDAFAAKINPTGTALLFSTYIGGSSTELAKGIALDSSNNVFVSGSTNSTNLTTTIGAYQTSNRGGVDAFVVKLNPTGTSALYATYVGGSSNENYWYDVVGGIGDLVVDSSGHAYITGDTRSSNLITTTGVYQSSYAGGVDAFLVKLNPTGTGAVYATYLGTGGEEHGSKVRVDATGHAYVVGTASSGTFPNTGGRSCQGLDAFVTKFNPTGTGLVYSTCIGGTGHDQADALAIDSAGHAYIAGFTNFTNNGFPITPGAYKTTHTDPNSFHVTKLSPNGNTILYSTFLNDHSYGSATSVAVDNQGNVIVAGMVDSNSFVTTPGVYQPSVRGFTEGFVVKLPMYALTFTVQPGSALINQPLSSQPVVALKDSLGNVVSDFDGPVTLAIKPGSGSGILSGTRTVNAVNGVATFSNLSINQGDPDFQLEASIGITYVIGKAFSAPFAIDFPPPESMTAVAGISQTAQINNNFSNSLRVRVFEQGGTTSAGRVITFTAPASGQSANFSNGQKVISTTTDTSGFAQVIATANNITGTYTVTATTGNFPGVAVFTLTNGTRPSAPTNLSATGGDRYVRLDWNPPPDPGFPPPVTNYQIYRASTLNGSYTILTTVSGDTLSYTNTNLAYNTSYFYRVYAVNTLGQSFAYAGSVTGTTSIAQVYITPTNGLNQRSLINRAFPTNFQVVVRDIYGSNMSGVPVTFTSPTTGPTGRFSNGQNFWTATTNASGIAAAGIFTASNTSGPFSVTVSAGNVNLLNSPAFAITNVVPSFVTPTAGLNQSALINTAYANALQVQLIADDGLPLAGLPVVFSAPTSGPSGNWTSGTQFTQTTNASGFAAASVFTANNQTGSFVITATLPGFVVTPVSFTLTNTSLPGAPISLTAIPGDRQIALSWEAPASTDSSPLLSYKIYRAPGTTGSFTLLQTISAPTQSYTDASLPYSTTYSYRISAVNNAGEGPYSAVVSATTNPPQAWITATEGLNQRTYIQTPFANRLKVSVRDTANSPLAGVAVTFRAPESGASGTFTGGTLTATITTNASGEATAPIFTANNIGGVYSVTISVVGVTPLNPLPTFVSTNVTASAISATTGVSQTALIDTNFPVALGVIVTGSDNLPVGGAVVTFSAPTDGASGTFSGGFSTVTATTATDGRATAPVFRANNLGGTYNVTATVSGLASAALFTFTNVSVPDAPTQITATAIVNRKIAVEWTPPGNSGSGSVTAYKLYRTTAPLNTFELVTTTTASSLAYTDTNLAYNTTYLYRVSAVNSSGEGALSNIATATTNIAQVYITPTSRLGQYVLTGTLAPYPFSVGILDNFGQPVPNLDVTFSATTSGARGTFSGSSTVTVKTNGVGQAIAPNFLANLETGPYSVTVAISGATVLNNLPSFAVTNTRPATITLWGGSNQRAVVGTVFATPLQVNVTDIYGLPLGFAPVTFYAPSGGASGIFPNGQISFTTNTQPNGIAQPPYFTANTITGTYGVTATVAGLPTVITFNLQNTNTPSAPLSTTAIGGSRVVSLTWQAPATSGTGTVVDYHVYRAKLNSGYERITSIPVTTTEYIARSLSHDTTYLFQITALNQEGEGPYSTPVSATTFPAPIIPEPDIALSQSEITFTNAAPLAGTAAGDVAIRVYNNGYITATSITLHFTDTLQADATTVYTASLPVATPIVPFGQLTITHTLPVTGPIGLHRLCIGAVVTGVAPGGLPETVFANNRACKPYNFVDASIPPNRIEVKVENREGWQTAEVGVPVLVRNTGREPMVLSGATLTGDPRLTATLLTPLSSQPIAPGGEEQLSFKLSVPPTLTGATFPFTPTLAVAVTSALGANGSDDFDFKIYESPPAQLSIKVVNQEGNPVPGTLLMLDGNERFYQTNGAGLVSIPSQPGIFELYSYAKNYLARSDTVTITTGGSNTFTVTLTPGQTLEVTDVAARQLTPEEIVARGVQLNDPANFWVYDFTIYLPLATYPVPNVILPANPQLGTGYPIGCACGGGGAAAAGGPSIGGWVHYVAPGQRLETWIVIPGRFRILKQFWEATIYLNNYAQTANPNSIVITDITATLNVPNGLALPPLFGSPQPAAQRVDPIPAGGSRQINWIVRGDAAGTYQLGADVTAKLQFGNNTTNTIPLTVTAAPAELVVFKPVIDVSFTVPSYVQKGVEFNLTINTVNPTLATLYEMSVELLPNEFVNVRLGAGETALKYIGKLEPGESKTTVFRLVPDITGCIDIPRAFVDSDPNIVPHLNFEPSRCGGLLGHTTCAVVNTCLPINSGNFVDSYIDLSLIAGGNSPLPLHIARTYNSANSEEGLFGRGWSSNLDNKITIDASGTVTLTLGDGGTFNFSPNPAINGAYFTPPRANGTLQKDGGGGWIFKNAQQISYAFNSAGKLVRMFDPNFNEITFEYEPLRGNISRLRDNYGHTIYVTTTTANRIAAVSDGERSVFYGYSPNFRQLEMITGTRGSAVRFNYDSTSGQLTQKYDELGRLILTNVYDSQRRLVEQTNSAGVNQNYLSRFDLSGPAGQTRFTDPRGGVTVFNLDSQNGQITSVTDALNQTRSYGYNQNGDPVVVTGTNGVVLRSEYNASGMPTVATSTVTVNGNAQTIKSETIYNSFNDPTNITDPSNNTWAFNYARPARPSVTTDPLGQQTTYEYDAQARTTRITTPGGLVTTYEYNPKGYVSVISKTYSTLVLGSTTPVVKTYRTDYTYNPQGWLTFQSDPYDAANPPNPPLGTRFEYDKGGNVLTTTNQLGQKATSQYDAVGNLIAKTNFLGQRVTYSYDALRRMTNVTEEGATGNLITIYEYDPNSNLIARTDPRGVRTSYGYDALNRLITTTVPLQDGSVDRVVYGYDAGGNLTSVLRYNPKGSSDQLTLYEYDELGRVVQTTVAAGQQAYKTRLTYDKTDNVVRTQVAKVTGASLSNWDDPAQVVTTESSFDKLNRVTAQTTYAWNPLNGTNTPLTSRYVYADTLNRVTTTNPYGVSYVRQNDAFGRTISLQANPASGGGVEPGAVVQTSYTYYDSRNLPIRIIDASGNFQDSSYDALGRLTSQTSYTGVGGTGTTLTANYYYQDSSQPSVSRVGPAPHYERQDTKADEFGRVLYTTIYTGSPVAYPTVPAGALTYNYAYDGQGNRTRITNPNGHEIFFSYENTGWLKTVNQNVTKPGGSVQNVSIGYEYDNVGNVLGATNANGKTTQATYDALNRLSSLRDPVGSEYLYNYDGLSRLVGMRDAKNQFTGYVYDNASRLLQQTSAGGLTTEFTYNAHGQPLTMIDRENVNATPVNTSYRYDGLNRLVNVTSGQGAVQYAYDNGGRPTNLSFNAPSEAVRQVTYRYDGLNRVTNLTDWRGGNYSYTYNGARLSQVALPNNVTTAYGYDGAGRVTSVAHSRGVAIPIRPIKSQQTAFFEATYTYDRLGNPITINEQLADGTNRNRTLVYDEMNRLLTENTSSGLDSRTSTSYEYDNAGNRRKMTTTDAKGNPVETSYNYDDANRLLNQTTRSFTNRVVSSSSYNYDANHNLLSEVRTANDITTDILYRYDSRNRLRQRQEGRIRPSNVVAYNYNGANQRTGIMFGRQATTYLNDPLSGQPLLTTLNEAGVISTKTQLYAPGLGQIYQELSNEKRFWLHTDATASTRITSNPDGTTESSFNYDAFGTFTTPATPGGITSLFGNQQLDPNNLYFTGSDYYDPATGRALGGTIPNYDSGEMAALGLSGNGLNALEAAELGDTMNADSTAKPGMSQNCDCDISCSYTITLIKEPEPMPMPVQQRESRQSPLGGLFDFFSDLGNALSQMDEKEALSLMLDFIPIVGDIKGLAEAVTGKDLITGRKLEGWERALNVVGAIPLLGGAFDAIKAVTKFAGNATGIGKAASRGASALGNMMKAAGGSAGKLLSKLGKTDIAKAAASAMRKFDKIGGARKLDINAEDIVDKKLDVRNFLNGNYRILDKGGKDHTDEVAQILKAGDKAAAEGKYISVYGPVELTGLVDNMPGVKIHMVRNDFKYSLGLNLDGWVIPDVNFQRMGYTEIYGFSARGTEDIASLAGKSIYVDKEARAFKALGLEWDPRSLRWYDTNPKASPYYGFLPDLIGRDKYYFN
jgi:YD repeat-containing protein